MKLHSNRRAYDKRKRLPKNREPKNPKVIIGSLAAVVISVLVLCMVIVIGVVGVSSGGKTVSRAGEFHGVFMVDSKEGAGSGTTFEMKGPCTVKDNVMYVPADGLASALGGTIVYNENSGSVKFKNTGKRPSVEVGSDVLKYSLLGSKHMDAEVYAEEGVVYVPARSFFEILGYGVEYTSSSKRIDVFTKSPGADELPTALFTTDKDTYNVGEKITFTAENQSPEGYEIVDEKWENRADWYFESGEVTVSYSVKDYKGNWSEPVSKKLTIEGEYHPANSVPVLAYFYIVEDSDKISKTVKEEKETKEKDPADPTGQKEITKKETVTKLVKGPYYGDSMVISLDQFNDEMAYLAQNDFNTITVSEYVDYIKSGVMPPVNSVILMFLNGYQSTYNLAYPVLKEYGFCANIAPLVKTLEDRSALVAAVDRGEEGAEDNLDEFDSDCRFSSVTFDQLKEMIADGTFEVGAISYDSNDYGSEDEALLAAPTYLDDQERMETDEEYASRVKEDVTAAITVLCENLGEENTPFFVYPYGEYSDVLIDALKNAGYSSGFTKGDGYLHFDDDFYHLERMNITQSYDLGDFKGLF